jgi:flagellar protein FlbT
MPLKVELKPNERIIVGDCLLINGEQRARFTIKGSAPILREKDIMIPDQADTPAKRIYLMVQLMYTSHDPGKHHELYFSLVRDIVQAAPSTWPLIEAINNQILTGNLYKALKESRKLIEYERELMQYAKRGAGLRKRGKADPEPARA